MRKRTLEKPNKFFKLLSVSWPMFFINPDERQIEHNDNTSVPGRLGTSSPACFDAANGGRAAGVTIGAHRGHRR